MFFQPLDNVCIVYLCCKIFKILFIMNYEGFGCVRNLLQTGARGSCEERAKRGCDHHALQGRVRGRGRYPLGGDSSIIPRRHGVFAEAGTRMIVREVDATGDRFTD